MISQVAASEREEAQTAEMRGCRNCTKRKLSNQKVMESTARDGESPVRERECKRAEILSTTGHEKSCRKQAGPSAKANINE